MIQKESRENSDSDLNNSFKGSTIIKENIKKVRNVSNFMRSSFGPMGMDKIIKEENEEITITNDGATIMEKLKTRDQITSIIAELSRSQDEEIGDGTTGIILLAGNLLDQAEKLMEKGIHPTRIIEGYEHIADFCLLHLEKISKSIGERNNLFSCLLFTSMTAMNSKVINRSKKRLAEICVKAILAVVDIQRKDLNFDLIKIDGKIGGNLEDTTLINGIVIDKDFSHPQMPKEIQDVRIGIVTSPLEPPKPKTKHRIEIENVENYRDLETEEKKYFKEMIFQVKKSGANLLICQWGFDDEGNHLLLRNKLSAIRWASGQEIDLLSLTTGAHIVPRFNEMTSTTLGFAEKIRENSFGNTRDRILVIENCARSKAITIFIRAGSDFILNEAKRAINDSLFALKNIFRDNRILFGGGSAEMACALKISEETEKSTGLKNYILQGFSESLKTIPLVLAENAGYFSIEVVSQLQIRQRKEKNPFLGVECLGNGVCSMQKLKVFESLISKQQQIQMAVQICNGILRIDNLIDVRKPDLPQNIGSK